MIDGEEDAAAEKDRLETVLPKILVLPPTETFIAVNSEPLAADEDKEKVFPLIVCALVAEKLTPVRNPIMVGLAVETVTLFPLKKEPLVYPRLITFIVPEQVPEMLIVLLHALLLPFPVVPPN